MWALFAVIASAVNAIYYICNQNVKLKPSIFMVYRGGIIALMVLPVLFFYEPVRAWQFYAIAILQGIITSYNDWKSFKSNRKYGAETVCSIVPMNVSFTFMIWCFIEPMIILQYAKSPLRSMFIIAALSGIVYTLSKYRKVKITREAFIALLPVMIGGSFIAIFNKTIMEYAESSLYGLCFWRVFVTSLVVGSIHIFIYAWRGNKIKELINKQNLRRCWIFVFMPISMVCRNMAMFYAENPSYVAALVQVSLLWVMFFNRYMPFIHCKKMCMKMDKKWALLMLMSVIVLIVATR